jgi:hypothetical protein
MTVKTGKRTPPGSTSSSTPAADQREQRRLVEWAAALTSAEFQLLLEIDEANNLERALAKLKREAAAYSDEGPPRLAGLLFENRRRGWYLRVVNDSWVKGQAHPLGRGRITKLPSRERLRPQYDKFRQDAKLILQKRPKMVSAHYDHTGARKLLRRMTSEHPRWSRLDVQQRRGEMVLSFDDRPLDIEFHGFITGKVPPSVLAVARIAAVRGVSPETVRMRLFGSTTRS